MIDDLALTVRPMGEIGKALSSRIDDVLARWSSLMGEEATNNRSALAADAREVLGLMAGTLPAAERRAEAEEATIQEVSRSHRLLWRALIEEVGREELLGLMDRFGEVCGQRMAAIAEGRSEAQARYMSFLSHDLRGTLNGVILMLEVLRREINGNAQFAESTADIMLMRKSILEAVERMERHLQADRLRRGRIEAQAQVMAIRPVVETVVAQQAAGAKEKGMELSNEVDERFEGRADREILRMAMANLVENAVRHGRGGAVQIKARARKEGWELVISDQGPGIAPERLRQLLDPVQRMQLKDRGVGLMIAYYAARAMGGQLEGESEPGKGSTFRIVLPGA